MLLLFALLLSEHLFYFPSCLVGRLNMYTLYNANESSAHISVVFTFSPFIWYWICRGCFFSVGFSNIVMYMEHNPSIWRKTVDHVKEWVKEKETRKKSQSYGVASAPRLTYQQWKTAVHDLTISIFLPSESRCFVQYYITIVDIGRSLFIIFTILVSTIKTISEGKRNTKERVQWKEKKKQDDWNHRRETLFLCGAPSSDSLTNRSEYVDYLKRKEPDTNLLQR